MFADRSAGLLFSGDHVLPTITPSIGFTFPAEEQPLGDFMASLAKVRALPDLRILPAHGPVAPSSHARVDELLAFHEQPPRPVLDGPRPGTRNSADVAGDARLDPARDAYDKLDEFARGMAAMETKAHLDLLVARGEATANRSTAMRLVLRARADPTASQADRRFGPSHHRDVRDVVLEELRSGDLESERRVPADQRRLGVQDDVAAHA